MLGERGEVYSTEFAKVHFQLDGNDGGRYLVPGRDSPLPEVEAGTHCLNGGCDGAYSRHPAKRSQRSAVRCVRLQRTEALAPPLLPERLEQAPAGN